MGLLCIEVALAAGYCVLYAVYSAKKRNKAAAWGMAVLCVALAAALGSLFLLI